MCRQVVSCCDNIDSDYSSHYEIVPVVDHVILSFLDFLVVVNVVFTEDFDVDLVDTSYQIFVNFIVNFLDQVQHLVDKHVMLDVQIFIDASLCNEVMEYCQQQVVLQQHILNTTITMSSDSFVKFNSAAYIPPINLLSLAFWILTLLTLITSTI